MNLTMDIESYGNEIIDLLGSADFTSKLTAITAEKGNDFTLDDFIVRKYGWASVESDLPALYVMGLREELQSDEGESRWVIFRFAIEVYVSGDDAEQLERKTNRYARAIDETLIGKYRDEGTRNSVDYSPVMKYEDSLFKVCSIQYQIRVFQDIT